jgi:sugar lactone lactonase YvrE
MRSTTSRLFLTMLVSLCGACTPAASPPAPPAPTAAAPAQVRSIDGFSVPESVLYDPVGDCYLVANIVGHPLEPDHDGFVSRVSPEGRVTSLRFVDGKAVACGLSAPKGMGLVGRTLWVADIDRLRAYDADTGAAQGEVPVAGASLLNDVTVAPDGTVYVTDTGIRRDGDGFAPTGTDSVYALSPRRELRRIASGELGLPNGILWRDHKLELVTLGSGEWITLTEQGGVERRRKLAHGTLDGIVETEDHTLLVSSWQASSVFALRGDAQAEVRATGKAPADIGYDTRRRRLLVPLMQENRLLVVPMGD